MECYTNPRLLRSFDFHSFAAGEIMTPGIVPINHTSIQFNSI